MADTDLLKTPLYDLHVELGAKMVPFAGYDMPVQYPMGVKAEHLHTRTKAGLFDVSHMGQVKLTGPDAARDLERLVPGDLDGLGHGQMRYSMFTNEAGGILDDLMVCRIENGLMVVVNAACKAADIRHMRAHLSSDIEVLEDRALIALQGPGAEMALSALAPAAAALTFMTGMEMDIDGAACFVTRSGYTGEDGYEISVPTDQAEALARKLLAQNDVEAIGLGARDSLRLEAGLCLYGHDIDETTTPVEAALTWSIGKRRRAEGGFPGADIILKQIAEGTARKRVGILPEGRAPAREGTEIQAPDGTTIGSITSGGFGPSLEAPVAMGYVTSEHAAAGSAVNVVVRGKALPARTAKMPFVPNGYKR
ncbi:MAG: glycine cleavage system aminomethyltransferase GcvT [Nisaea sp.]|uniref:glycine cleavage system aminomethyltransferase GcvT n=1 Tax=Nisaea sp. TaxID=2024842 RepID=UPI001B0403B1|nr:glycine cleavage system aminomethyltransferase GcvT [Nisaea sp.]MBO6561773.1 glycine cleavage system aminomethyltransferase GcvT [Nisaea sp.]